MDGNKKGRGENGKWRTDWRNLRSELKELSWLCQEYWEGFGAEKGYETRVYIDRNGIRLFQSSTIEAETPAASAPLPSHPLRRMCVRLVTLIYLKMHYLMQIYAGIHAACVFYENARKT